MPRLISILCAMALLSCPSGHTEESPDAGTSDAEDSPMQTIDLSAHRWQHRVILLFAPTSDDASYAAMSKEIWSRPAGVEERDLIVYELFFRQTGMAFGRGILPAATRKLAASLDVPPDHFTFLLIGKDGGVKMRSSEPTPVPKIFRTIDAMPMRQREMRRQD